MTLQTCLLSTTNIFDITNITNKSNISPITKLIDDVYGFVTGAVVGYKSTYEPDVMATFADFVLSKQKERIDKLKKELDAEDNYSDQDIIVQVFTLLIAGAVTTVNTNYFNN